jgi:subtilisin family serine protease
METERKISPAFEQFLAETGPNDKRDAIVIYSAPMSEEERMQGRLRAISKRLDFVRARAAAQGPIQAKLMEDYKKAGSKHLSKKSARKELEIAPIGASTLPVASAQVTRKTLPALAAQPNVVAILPNQRIHLIKPKEVNYAELGNQENKDGMTWGLKELGIPEVWGATKNKGKGIKVAVLDTGVHGEHTALAERVKDFVVIDPLGRRIKANPAFDCGSHGTHVCGTIAGGKTASGVSIGVAPEATLFVAGVLVGDATLQTLIEGMAWAIEKGADIINMSLGFTYYEPLFAMVFDMLIDQYGIMPVVAIGNENHGNSSSPGNAYNAFSIGAVEKIPRGKIDIPFFSSGASLVFPGAERGALVTKPDVVAPGVQVFSCIPPQRTPEGTFEYTYMDGTSMATPHVAGVAALLMAAKPQAQVSQVINALKDTARHPAGDGGRPDNRWGYGMVQPLEALKALS